MLSSVSLERGLLIALAIAFTGLVGSAWSVWQWSFVHWGPLTVSGVRRVLTFSLVLIASGVQLAFEVFLLGVIDMLSHRHGDVARFANARFGKPATLLRAQGLFLIALAIVPATEGSPVKILHLMADCLEGMFG